MNQKSRIYLAVIPAAVILLAVVLAVSMGTAGNEEVTITIYHTNDMHGHLEDLAYTIPLRDATPNALLVNAGDDTQGTLLTTATNGTAVLTLMNAADYDLMTLGNHESIKEQLMPQSLPDLRSFRFFRRTRSTRTVRHCSATTEITSSRPAENGSGSSGSRRPRLPGRTRSSSARMRSGLRRRMWI